MAEYDHAAWRATDAMTALPRPDSLKFKFYIARKTDAGWEAVFGDFDAAHGKFMIAGEALQSLSSGEFHAHVCSPAKEGSEYYFAAARALELARNDFKHEPRPYNYAVLPAPGQQLYVYLYPAQTDAKVWPLGGDIRYLIAADGSTIVERRRMHNDILEFKSSPEVKTEYLFHTAFLDDAPEDTDVFLAMSFKPPATNLIATRHFVYFIDPDGGIPHATTVEAFFKK